MCSVHHPPRSVPLGMQSANKAKLESLVDEGIITEVHEHTESEVVYYCNSNSNIKSETSRALVY